MATFRPPKPTRSKSKDSREPSPHEPDGAGRCGEDHAGISVEDLKDRLAGVQRRLAKADVRVAALDAQLRKERDHASELTTELAAARHVPRPGQWTRPPANAAHGEAATSLEDEHQDRRHHVEALCGGLEFTRLPQGANSTTGLPPALIEQRLRDAAAQAEEGERERAAVHLTSELEQFGRKLRTQAREHEEQTREVVAACRQEIVQERQACQDAEHIEVKTALEASECNARRVISEAEAQVLALQEEAAGLQGELAVVRLANEGQEHATWEQEERVQCIAAESKITRDHFAHELRARDGHFHEQLADLNAQQRHRLADAEAETQAACDRNLAEVRERLEATMVEHRLRWESEAHDRCEAQCIKQLNDQSVLCDYRVQECEEEVCSHITLWERRLAQQMHEKAEMLDEFVSQRAEHNAEQASVEKANQSLRELLERVRSDENRIARALHTSEAAADSANELRDEAENRLRDQFLEFRLERRQSEEMHEAALTEALARATSAGDGGSSGSDLYMEKASALKAEVDRISADNTRLRAQLEAQACELEQRSQSLDAARARLVDIQKELDNARPAEVQASRARLEAKAPSERGGANGGGAEDGGAKGSGAKGVWAGVSDGSSAGAGETEELQELLRFAFEENKELRAKIAEQAEEISLLESRVLGALDDIRDEGATNRRWGGRASSVPPRSHAAGAALGRTPGAPASADTSRVGGTNSCGRPAPARRPGDIRRGAAQPKNGSGEGLSIGGLLKM